MYELNKSYHLKNNFSIICYLILTCAFYPLNAQVKIESINQQLNFQKLFETNLQLQHSKSFSLLDSLKLLKLDSLIHDSIPKYAKYSFSIKDCNTNKVSLSIFTILNHLSNYSMISNSKYLVIENYREIIALKFNLNSNKHLSSYFTTSSFNKAKIINDVYYGLKCNLNGYDYSKKSNTEVLTYDFKLDRWKELLLPDPYAVEMTYFQPRNLIDTDGKFYYVAEPLKYKVNIFDTNGDSICDIKYSDTLFSSILFDTTAKEVFLKSSQIYHNEPKQIIDKFRHIVTSNFSLWKIDMASDSVMLILWSIPGKKNRLHFYLDVWKKNKSNWSINKRFELYDNNNDKEQILTKYNFTTIDNIYYIENNKFIIQSALPPNPTNYFNTGMKVGEFKKLTEEYFKKNDINYYILVYDMSKLLE